MKRKAALIVVMFVALSVSAKVSFGIKGGLNLYRIDRQTFASSNRSGFFLGPTCKFTLPIIGLGMDVSFVYDETKTRMTLGDGTGIDGQPIPPDEHPVRLLYPNMSVSGNETPAEGDISMKRTSFSLPINVRYQVFGIGDAANVFIYTGPQFSFNIGSMNAKIKEFKDEASGWTLRSSTFSWNLGLGISLSGHLQVNANYNAALGRTGDQKGINVAKTISEEYTKLFKASNSNTWQLGLVYYF